jgi:iron complex transport system substrate-binding protein
MPPLRPVPIESPALLELWVDLRRQADALGVPERGVQLITRMRTRLEAVALRAAQQPRRPRVTFLAGLDPPLVAAGWIRELVALAGGELVACEPGGARPLAPEDLASGDPDVLILAPAGMDLVSATAAARGLLARPGWQALRAVREGRLHAADGTALFGRAGPQAAEALEAIAEMLHPAAFRFGQEGRAWTRIAGSSGT